MVNPDAPKDKGSRYGISRRHYRSLVDRLNRTPTSVELGIVGGHWRGESAPWISRTVPPSFSQHLTEERQVSIGEDRALVLRAGSTQCPLSDDAEIRAVACISRAGGAVLALGGTPLVIGYSRYVGSWEKRGMKKLMRELAAGAKGYGSAVGISTRSEELLSDQHYDASPIFMAAVAGLVHESRRVRPVAEGIGNPVFLLGPESRGKEGLLKGERDRLDVCKDLAHRSYLVGMESVGPKGLAVTCARMAVRGGTGIVLNMARLHGLYKGKSKEEILFSDQLGRMLVVIAQGFEAELKKICRKAAIRCSRIGHVDGEEVFRVQRGKAEYASLPLEVFTESPGRDTHDPAPSEITHQEKGIRVDTARIPEPKSFPGTLMELLGTPDILADSLMAARRSEAVESAIDVPGRAAQSGVILNVSSAGRFAHLDPRSGGKLSVLAALRRSVCSGAVPKGVLSGVILGRETGESGIPIMKEVLNGQAEGLQGADIPAVNLYVERELESPYPTPVAAVVGLLEDPGGTLTPRFKDSDDFILLLGSHRGELGGSEYLNRIHGRIEGPPPVVDPAVEHRIHEILVMAFRVGLLKSVHPVSRGGLAVALIQCLVGAAKGTGVRIHMSSKLRPDELLFGETQGLVIVTIHEDSLIEIERLCMRMGVPCTAIGRVTDDGRFRFEGLIDLEVAEVEKLLTRRVKKLVWG